MEPIWMPHARLIVELNDFNILLGKSDIIKAQYVLMAPIMALNLCCMANSNGVF